MMWCDIAKEGTLPLAHQLTAAGITFSDVPIPHLRSLAACASLYIYTDPTPVVVLVIPQRGVDSVAETYYFFDGMTREEALESEQAWLDRYDICETLKPVPPLR